MGTRLRSGTSIIDRKDEVEIQRQQVRVQVQQESGNNKDKTKQNGKLKQQQGLGLGSHCDTDPLRLVFLLIRMVLMFVLVILDRICAGNVYVDGALVIAPGGDGSLTRLSLG